MLVWPSSPSAPTRSSPYRHSRASPSGLSRENDHVSYKSKFPQNDQRYTCYAVFLTGYQCIILPNTPFTPIPIPSHPKGSSPTYPSLSTQPKSQVPSIPPPAPIAKPAQREPLAERLDPPPLNGTIVPVAPGAPPPNALIMTPPRASVLVPTTTSVAPTPNETGVPDTVTTAPGARTWVPTMNADAESAVYVEPSKVKILSVTAGTGMAEDVTVRVKPGSVRM